MTCIQEGEGGIFMTQAGDIKSKSESPYLLGKPQKNGYFFSGPATKRGGGGEGLATKKKDRFLKL